MITIHFSLSMLGYQSVSGTAEVSSLAEGRRVALEKFFEANGIELEDPGSPGWQRFYGPTIKKIKSKSK